MKASLPSFVPPHPPQVPQSGLAYPPWVQTPLPDPRVDGARVLDRPCLPSRVAFIRNTKRANTLPQRSLSPVATIPVTVPSTRNDLTPLTPTDVNLDEIPSPPPLLVSFPLRRTGARLVQNNVSKDDGEWRRAAGAGWDYLQGDRSD